MVLANQSDAIQLFKIQLDGWDYHDKKYKSQLQATNQLKNMLLASIPFDVQRALGGPQGGFKSFNNQQIFQALEDYYLTPCSSDFAELARSLQKPYDLSDNFEVFISTHRSAHEFCATAAQPMTEYSKVTAILDALEDCKIFDGLIAHFKICHQICCHPLKRPKAQ